MKILLSIFFVLSFYTQTLSSEKEIIIKKLKLTNNFSFNFIQTIGEKNENGNCIIKYPKKYIVCMIVSIKKFLFQMENLWLLKIQKLVHTIDILSKKLL